MNMPHFLAVIVNGLCWEVKVKWICSISIEGRQQTTSYYIHRWFFFYRLTIPSALPMNSLLAKEEWESRSSSSRHHDGRSSQIQQEPARYPRIVYLGRTFWSLTPLIRKKAKQAMRKKTMHGRFLICSTFTGIRVLLVCRFIMGSLWRSMLQQHGGVPTTLTNALVHFDIISFIM